MRSGVYEPWTGQFQFFDLTGAAVRAPPPIGSVGDLPIVGDWNGDGVDEVGTYRPGGRTFAKVLPDGTVQAKVFGQTDDTPVAGDWNGDGTDDIGTFRPSSNLFVLDVPVADGVRVVVSPTYGSKRQLPVIGDWDGDGVDSEGIVTPS